MKICFYYKPIQKPWGGANSFIANLRKFFIKNNVAVTYDINSDYDILFLNSAYRAPGKMVNVGNIQKIRQQGYSSLLRRILAGNKKRKVKIVYRLDGLRKVYANIESKMDGIQLKCIHYADKIVFQSEFALTMFRDCGFEGDNFSIVHNGVNQDLFNMNDSVCWDGKQKLKVIACSWSTHVAKGYKIIADFSDFDDVEVCFIGDWVKGISPKKVRILGKLSHAEIARKFKQFHVFLFPSLNEACSNTLLEALSSGLPVLYADSGSNREISEAYGVSIYTADLRDSLDKIKRDYRILRENIKKDIDKFSIEFSGRKYLSICRSI